MKQAHAGLILRYIRNLAARGESHDLSDSALLERFLSGPDENAFAALVDRHGPMVLRACLRVLRDSHAAEGAFQATFFVLARKARSIGNRERLAGWLNRVASRIALHIRASSSRESAPSRQPTLACSTNPADVASTRELSAILDEELNRLPARYRDPLLLCHVEGQTRDQAARTLGLSLRTIKRRLDKGRDLLRCRLNRRGATLSAALLAASLSKTASATSVPAALAATATRAALSLVSGTPGASLGISAQALAAVETLVGGTAAVRLTVMLTLAMSAALAGTGLLAYQSTAVKPPAPEAARPTPAPPAPKQVAHAPHADRFGDPLPDGALLRLGTLRMRHADNIRALAFGPHENALLSADWHGVVVWDVATGKELRRFGNPRGRQFQSIAFSADGRTVVLTTSDGNVEVWDAAAGKVLFQFGTGRFPEVALSPDGKQMALEDYDAAQRHTLRLWNVPDQKEGLLLISKDTSTHGFVFSSDGKMLLTRAADEAAVFFWDVATGTLLRHIQAPANCLGPMALSPDGKFLALGTAEKFVSKLPGGGTATGYFSKNDVYVLETMSGKVMHKITNPLRRGAAFSFTPDSKSLLVGDGKGIGVWDMGTGREHPNRRLLVPNGCIFAFSHDGKVLATGSSYGALGLWDLAAGKELLPVSGHQGPVAAVAQSADARLLATGGADGVVRLWNAPTGKQARALPGQGGYISALAFLPDNRSLVSAGYEQSAQVWDTTTGKEKYALPGEPKGIPAISISPDGNTAALAGPKQVILWNLIGNKEVRRLPIGATVLAHSPDGKALFTWSADHKVRVWDVATGTERRAFEGYHFSEDAQDRVYTVAFSPNGRLVAFGGQLNWIALFDMATGKKVRALAGLRGAVSKLSFSPDSRVLASGDWTVGTANPQQRGPIHLWEVATGQQLRQLDGHHGRILALSFSPDGKRLISGSADGTALVWDVSLTPNSTSMPRSAEDTAGRWKELADPDAGRAQQALRALMATPNPTIEFLQKRLKPATAGNVAQIAALIADFESDDFNARERASAALERLHEKAEPLLRRTLSQSRSAELSDRVKSLLDKIDDSPDRLRTGRVLQLLEQLGTSQAHKLLRDLAIGAPGAWITDEAKACLERIAQTAAQP